MAMAKWRMVWTYNDTVAVGEIDAAYDRKFTFRLNAPNTIEFKVPMTSSIGKLIAASPYGFGLVKLYSGNTLKMVAEASSIQIVGKSGERSIAVVATETMYPKMEATLLAPTVPITFPAAAGQAGAKLFSGFSATFSSIGLATGTAGTTASINPSLFDVGTSLLSLVQALAFRGSGFDFWATPIEPAAAANGYTADRLEIAALRGSNKPNAAFEFGENTKANCDEYTYTASSGDHLCNIASVVGPNNSTTAVTVASLNTASIVAFGVRRRYITTDIDDPTLRQQLADIHTSKRGYPRLMLTLKPSPSFGDGHVPQFGTDYDVGDIVPATVKDSGSTIVNGTVRIYGVIVSPDASGMENIELELNPDTA